MTPSESPAAGERTRHGTLHVLDTSDLRGGYVLDRESGVQLRLSELAYRVLAAPIGASFDEVAIQCSTAERRLTARDVAHLYDRVVAGITAAEQQRRRRGLEQGFLLRLTLIPATLAWRMAAPFAVLFGPVAALLATLLIACTAAYWSATQRAAPGPVSGYEFLAGCGLFLISCLAHELGHAGACIRFGVRPGPIGLALYLVFPVFYSDVTRIWRLNRWQRVAVDVGGSYVQCLCAACYVLIYVQTHAAAFFVATSLTIASTLLNLNPLFRFDGYWIVSDSLGVTGLAAHAWRLFRSIASRRAGPPEVSAPQWPGHILAAVTIYSILVLAGWAWFVARLTAIVLEQGRWLIAVGPALASHRKELSLALAGQFGATIVASVALVYCLLKLLRFVRGTAARQ